MKQIRYSVTILGSMEVPSTATDKDIKELILADYKENEPNDIEWEEEEPEEKCKYALIVPTTEVTLCSWFFENSSAKSFCHFPVCDGEKCKIKLKER